MSSFTCCKNKESTVLFCVVCKKGFHRSCWTRLNKQYTIVRDSLAVCSRNCMDAAAEDEPDTFDILKSVIEDLKTEIIDKDNYIAPLKRSSVSLMEDTSRSEESFLKEITEKDKKIDELKNGIEELKIKIKAQKQQTDEEINLKPLIKELKEKNKNPINQINDNERFIIKLKGDLSDLVILKNQMKDALVILEADNRIYAENEAKLKNELGEKKEDLHKDSKNEKMGKQKQLENNEDLSTERSGKMKNRGRLLILCDEYGRHLDRSFGVKYNKLVCQTIIKPGASFEMVTKDIVELVKDFTLDDYVLIMAGSNDVDILQFPSFRDINKKLKYCTHTNIVLTSIPYMNYRKNGLDERVQMINKKLYEYAD